MALVTRNPADRDYPGILRMRQGNILALGIATTGAGILFLGNIVALSSISWPIIGMLLCATAVMQGCAASQMANPKACPAWGAMIAYYITFGCVAFTDPSERSAAMNLTFFAGLISIGIARGVFSCNLRRIGGCRWLMAGSAVTLACGLYFLSQWPENNLLVAGVLLACDLAAFGVSLIGFSIGLGRDAKHQRW